MTEPPLRLLGQPRWHAAGDPVVALGPQRHHQLLALLGWLGSHGAPSGVAQREWLAELFWPAQEAAAARSNLRKVLLEARHWLATLPSGPFLEDSRAGLRWLPGTDVQRFERACAAGEWAQAAALGSGVPLEGLGLEQSSPALAAWLQQQRQWHHRHWRAAVLKALPLASPAEASELAAALLQADPQDSEGLALSQALKQRSRTDTLAPTLAPLAPLVGREAELQSLLQHLATRRWVTVLGPGGVGKSRLARHAADQLAAEFVHGAALVPLDDLSTPSALAERMAQVLGLMLVQATDAAQAMAALARALAPRAMLLVLDGFEAVIDAAAFVPRLLSAAPGLRVIVTSRERLEVDGEQVLPLAALETPRPGASLDELLASPAVRLFAARAIAVRPDFDVHAAAEAVAQICRRVGGLPLAIEWAAVWVRVMSAADLAQDIEAGAASRGDDGPTAVFESSWRLLTAAERQAYAALAVFRGGFDRDAAEQVAGVRLAVLASLVDKSMLRAAASGRMDMHPLVHDHARHKLAQLAEAPTLAAAHARCYLSRLQQMRPMPEADHENLLAAWHHVVHIRDATAVESALARLQWSTVVMGRRAEAASMLAQAAAWFGTSSRCGALLQAHEAWVALWLEDDGRACELSRKALQVLRHGGHSAGCAMALRTLGHAARRAGDAAAAARLFEEALKTLQTPLDATQTTPSAAPDLRAALHDALAMVLIEQGRFERARAQLRVALVLNEASGDEVQRMYNHYNFSRSHSLAGQADPALPWAESALALGQVCGLPFFLPYLHAELARVLHAQGRHGEAAAQADRALARAQDTGDRAALGGAHLVQARVLLAVGDRTAAQQAVARAAHALRDSRFVTAAQPLPPLALAAFEGDPRCATWRSLAPRDLLEALARTLEQAGTGLAETPRNAAKRPAS